MTGGQIEQTSGHLAAAPAFIEPEGSPVINWESKSSHEASAHGLIVKITDGRCSVALVGQPGTSGRRSLEQLREMRDLLDGAIERMSDAKQGGDSITFSLGTRVDKEHMALVPQGTYLEDAEGDFWRRSVTGTWNFRRDDNPKWVGTSADTPCDQQIYPMTVVKETEGKGAPARYRIGHVVEKYTIHEPPVGVYLRDAAGAFWRRQPGMRDGWQQRFPACLEWETRCWDWNGTAALGPFTVVTQETANANVVTR